MQGKDICQCLTRVFFVRYNDLVLDVDIPIPSLVPPPFIIVKVHDDGALTVYPGTVEAAAVVFRTLAFREGGTITRRHGAVTGGWVVENENGRRDLIPIDPAFLLPDLHDSPDIENSSGS